MKLYQATNWKLAQTSAQLRENALEALKRAKEMEKQKLLTKKNK